MKPKHLLLTLTVTACCAVPAIFLNVWPRVANMITNGVSSNELGIICLVTMSVLTMTTVPFAMKKADNIGFWYVCLSFGLVLGVLNYLMAVGAVGKAHDAGIYGSLDRANRAESLKTKIEQQLLQRRALGDFKFTTPDMLSSADLAVKLALEARDKECERVADHCRARQAQLAARQEDRAQLAASRAITDRAEQLESRIQALDRELQKLGYISADIDPQATRIAGIVSIFFNLGADATTKVGNGLIHFLAVMAEAFALVVPRIILTAILPQGRPVTVVGVSLPPIALSPPVAKKPALIPPPPATPAPARKPSPIQKGDPLSWKATCLQSGPENLRTWDAFTHYQKWCNGNKPLDFPEFKMVLGLKTEMINKREHYLGVSLK